jgi:hypothetical protein
MGKKILIAGVVIFIAWAVVDFIVHGWILQGAYAATARFWRPMAEMKMGLMYFTTLISALAFSAIFGFVSDKKGLGRGILFGLLYGVGVGIPMGYGTYSYMPIPYPMALTWFLGTLARGVLGGILAGIIIRK